MAVVLEDLGVCYFPAPKVANTSIKHLMYQIEHGQGFVGQKDEQTGTVRHIHKEFPTPLFKELDLQEYEPLLRFAVIRDPVKRLLSAWRNRVIHHGELGEGKVSLDKLEKAGVPENPDLETFIDNLETYRAIKGSIFTHTAPLVDFLGTDSSYYHLVFTMEHSHLIEDFFHVLTGVRHSMGRSQTGGPKVSVDDVDPARIKRIKEFYAEDYEVFGSLLKSPGAGVSHGLGGARQQKLKPLTKDSSAKLKPMSHVPGYLPAIENIIPTTQCPACKQAEPHTEVQYPASSEKWAALRIVVCPQCGFGYVPEIDFDLDLYNREENGRLKKRRKNPPPEQFFSEIDSNKSRIARRARAHAKLLCEHTGEIDKLLEVGSDLGASLHYIPARWKAAADVDETSLMYLDYLGVRRTTLSSVHEADFDVIVLSHYLQNLPVAQVLKTLEKCRKLLAEDGKLLVEVPEWGSVNDRVPPKHGGHEPHLNFFSPEALARFLQSAGFTIQYLQTRDRLFEPDANGGIDLHSHAPRDAKDATHLLAIANPTLQKS